MIRAVVDTNVIISAFIKPNGNVGPILGRLLKRDYKMVSSHHLLSEVAAKLVLPRLSAKYHIRQSAAEEFIGFVATDCDVVVPQTHVQVCRDPKDNMVLEAAIAGQADYIVTGDKDLLVMQVYEGIEIVTPQVFLSRLDNKRR